MKTAFLFATLIILLFQSCSEQGGEQNPESVDSTSSSIIEVDGGLVIEIVEEGNSNSPEEGDIVFVEYTGRLKSTGEVVDSTESGQPFRFAFGKGRVIKGWDLGFAQLSEGSKARFTIPAHLGYGDRDRGPIPANSDLEFDVHLVRIKKAPKPMDQGIFNAQGLDTIETNSGLRYCIIEQGDGPELEVGIMAVVHYLGYFPASGQRFDDSFARGTPLEVVIGSGAVIPAWEEGLSMMRVGGKYKLLVPSYLAYGDRGFPGLIPPNADLCFDMQVVGTR